MHRGTLLTLAALSLALAAAPLGIHQPGLPSVPRADEPTYLLAAMSLAADGDLRCARADLRRLFEVYPFADRPELMLRAQNGETVAGTDDGAETGGASAPVPVFDVPLLYPLLATPFVAALGSTGPLALNVALLVLCLWLATFHLARRDTGALALLTAAGFLLLAPPLVYAFLVVPEMALAALVLAALFVGWPRDPTAAGWRRAALAGLCIGAAASHQPLLALLALPFLAAAASRRHWRQAGAWLLAGAAVWVLLAAAGARLTGPDGPATVRWRATVADPLGDLPRPPLRIELATGEVTASEATAGETAGETTPGGPAAGAATASAAPAGFWRALGYLVAGRHAGLVPYFPFALVALFLFVRNVRSPRPGDRLRWLLLATVAIIVVIHAVRLGTATGGGHPDDPVAMLLRAPANRLLLPLYPAFLFLIVRPRPAVAVTAGWAIAAFLAGPMILAPFGAPVAESTVHSHVRAAPFRPFPLELAWIDRLSDYAPVELVDGTLWRRPDETFLHADLVGTLGGIATDLWLETRRPLTDVTILATSPAARNRLHLRLGDAELEHVFEPGEDRRPSARLRLEPEAPTRTLGSGDRARHFYRLRVATDRGARPRWDGGVARADYLGVELAWLGGDAHLGRDLYAVDWLGCGAPATVAAGDDFLILARLRNASAETWPVTGAARVRFGTRWLDAQGTLIGEGRRADLPRAVPPGGVVEQWVPAVALEEPGSYGLELDLVFENVAWFGRQGTSTCVMGVRLQAEAQSDEN